MKYVLDACVALKWVLKEPDSPTALALREDFKRQFHEFLAPDTFLAERLRLPLRRSVGAGIVPGGFGRSTAREQLSLERRFPGLFLKNE